MMDTTEFLGELENLEKSNNVDDMEVQDAKAMLSESGWTLAFYDNENSELTSELRKNIDVSIVFFKTK